MKLPIYFFKGSPDKPSIIFIHGLGMDSLQWISPSETRIFGGALPLSILTRKPPEFLILKEKPVALPEKFTTGNSVPLFTSLNDFREKGYTVITWNQTKPLSSIYHAVGELKNVVRFANSLSDRGTIIIGNSRGGLIARKFIENCNEKIKAVISIATPHRGSTIAKWVKHVSLITHVFKPFLKLFPERIEKISRRLIDFLNSEAVRELLPDSPFIKSLKKIENFNFFCIAGSNPALFNIYEWKLKKENDSFILYPEKIFSFPQSIVSILTEKFIPPEWKYGDGLVSVESALIDKNSDIFNLNHAEIIVNTESRIHILNIVERIESES